MRKFLPFLLLLFTFSAIAQIQIEGKIIDGLSNETLIGATVIIKESGKGTSTNFDGEYSIIYKGKLPTILKISYLGYKSLEIEVNSQKPKAIKIFADSKNLKEVKVVDSRITQKQKEAALTVESLDMIAIKETPSSNFYDGIGALKGVDITAASLGFKVINTRGFNSTSPVRSLQIIDGVDNQSPGLNFSLGNFLGSSELDIQRVEIIQGASSAYYGPNAFNGVISMETRNPFIQPGLSIQYKFGNRNLFENSVRLAEKFQTSKGEDIFAFKINVSYMQAHDWEADNMDAVDGTTSSDNPGGYDAINRYGDEDTDGDLNNPSGFVLEYKDYPGLGKFHRTGYMEKDIVDYNTINLKAQSSLHFMLKPKTELIYSLNYSTGTTVYQGDNRFSLKNIQFWQNKIELRQKDKFFIRAYRTEEDAGDSYDAVSTALKLQEYNHFSNQEWYSEYKNNWRDNFSWDDVNWSIGGPTFVLGEGWVYSFNGELISASDVSLGIAMSDSVLNANTDLIITNHNTVRDLTDLESNRLVPGTEEFKSALKDITSKTAYLYGGSGFYDKSALNHIHSEYQFNPDFATIKIGANFRQYNPDTKGSLFMDTATMITNKEAGIYTGIETNLFGDFLKMSSTFRADKNENFDLNFSPAMSLVFKPSDKDIIRMSFSSAIRNPTLSDQYLYYNVGRAILIGNLEGHGEDYGENLVTVQSLINYYLPPLLERNKDSLRFMSVAPIKPEKTKSFEIGYRSTFYNKFYIDANYYISEYKDFIGYVVGLKYTTLIDDTVTGAYDISMPSIQAYRMAANAQSTVTTQGASIGLNYYLSPNITLNGNYSWNKLNKEGEKDPIIPAYNTPEHKYNLGVIGRDFHLSATKNILRDFGFSINYKWVDEFIFEGSPQFTGIVPTYDLLDLQISKKMQSLNTIIKVGSSNLLNNIHYEVYGGPYIGRMIYCSLLFDIK